MALDLLRSPDFFDHYLDVIARTGLVGEERNAAVLLVAGISRSLPRPLNVIVKGKSSSGKNYLVNRVLSLFPKNAVHELTSSSDMAWNYSGDDFRHRIVYLQERNEAAGAVHPVRLLISEGKLVRIVTVNEGGVRRAKRYEADGPIASISTTTKNQLEIDDETRHLSIWIDESPAQTKRILRGSTARPNAPPIPSLKVWHEAQRLLAERAEIPVVLPGWWKELADLVYDRDIRVRRYFPAFTTACQTVALIRSFQRTKENK